MRLLALALLALLVGLSPPTLADPRQVPQNQAQVQLSFAPVVARAAPAVVNISANRTVTQRPGGFSHPFMDDPFFRPFMEDSPFGRARPFGRLDPFSPPRFRQRLAQSLGSGVIVGPEGLIITNAHVIEGADDIRVGLPDRREFAAEVLVTDPEVDLAMLRLLDPPADALPTLALGNPDLLETGDLVLAIGNPFGVGQTVTSGIVSAKARTAGGITDFGFFIQTDAAINPGNSGGALVNLEGQLVGIPTAIYSRGGGSNGIGFAIPATMLRPLIQAALGDGQIRRAYIGGRFQPVGQDEADALGLDRPQGVLVAGVADGGVLAEAGVQVGDVILSVDGFALESAEALRFRLAALALGDRVTLRWWREGREQEGSATLKPPPETPPREPRGIEGRSPLAGAILVNLSPAVAEDLGIALDLATEQAVAVERIARGSPADRFGFEPGDLVLAINGVAVPDTGTAKDILEDDQRRKWSVVVDRDGQRISRQFVY